MRCLLQRVTTASVAVDGETVGEIGHGLMILFCAMKGDTPADCAKLAAKVAKLRMFMDLDGRTNKSIMDVGGACLIVSQFTLSADTSRGNRPGFSNAAPADDGRALYEQFCDDVRAQGLTVETGRFGASMQVSLINNGPFTIWLDV